MIVLGVDPGTIRTGWGVVERRGTRMVHHGHGAIRARREDSLEKRLCAIFEQLEIVIAEHRPVAVAVEDVFGGKHAQSALRLGHARGVVLLSAARAGLEGVDGGRLGDVIVAVNDAPVAGLDDLLYAFEGAGVGAEVTLTVRRDGKDRKVKVRLIAVK